LTRDCTYSTPSNRKSTDKKALEQLKVLGRRRLSEKSVDLIPEGSGRAVTPDCPRIPRGSSPTVERFDPVAYEADLLLAIFGEVFAN
jgi:hypothetical protein